MSGGNGSPPGGPTPRASTRIGILNALTAYVLWGILPLYFIALAPANAFEIVAWRVLFSLVFCVILLAATRGWGRLLSLMRSPRILFTMAAAGALVFVNWQTYILATTSGEVVQSALGYFINPVVTVFLGVLLLRERLRAAQWLAVGVSIVAVAVLAIGAGQVPWVSLVLAFSFGFYGLIKKRVGGEVDAVSGLTLETLWLAPVAVIELLVVSAVSTVTFATDGVLHAILLMGAGVITAVPLLLFAGAAQRLPLVMMGFIQYLVPILQFVVGVAFLHESMPPIRWIGFGIVWLALAILSADMLRAWRRTRTSAPAPERAGIIERSAG
jgi:chloramphenicol-sensitive protein RarD